mmetsp:Transcript_28580/g.32677  ORF Transcript_28580/g.32677 Transcript_28580/m.32677 type:complete len:348 (+) Transcript_28580:26-1069(+)
MESGKTIKIAMFGCGRIGRLHAKNILSGVYDGTPLVLTKVFDAVPEAVAAFKKDFNFENVAEKEEEILQDSAIDAILICTPTTHHARLIKAGLQNGKHVLCEKPAAISVEEADEVLAEHAKYPNLKLMIGFNRRFDESFLRMRERIQRGDIGEILNFSLTSRDRDECPESYVKTSGGIFKDMAIHDFDMLRYILGSECNTVYAVGESRIQDYFAKHSDVDTAVVTFTFQTADKKNVFGTLNLCRKTSYGYDQRLEVFGKDGMLVSDNKRNNDVTLFSGTIARDQEAQDFLFRYGTSYKSELKIFAKAILEDTECSPSMNDSKQALLLARACEKALKEKRPVDMNELQ